MNDEDAARAANFEEIVGALLKFTGENYPDLPALDAAGALVIAGTRVGSVANLDAEMPDLLRTLADRFEQRAAERGVPN